MSRVQRLIRAGEIYDGLAVKNMPKDEFMRRYEQATDPARVTRELNGILNKKAVDSALRSNQYVVGDSRAV